MVFSRSENVDKKIILLIYMSYMPLKSPGEIIYQTFFRVLVILLAGAIKVVITARSWTRS